MFTDNLDVLFLKCLQLVYLPIGSSVSFFLFDLKELFIYSGSNILSDKE